MRIKLRPYAGRIGGTLLGLLSGLGFFGLLFGLLLGTLLDILLRELHIRRQLRRASHSPSQWASDYPPQLRWVLVCSWYSIHTAHKTARERERRLSSSDVELLRELILNSLTLSPGARSAVSQLFDTAATTLSSETPPGAAPLPPLNELRSMLSEEPAVLAGPQQIAVSRVLFEAATLGSGSRQVSGNSYHFIQARSRELGIRQAYVEIAAEILGLKDTSVYEILGVGPDTSQEEVKKVYRTLAAQFHPDSLYALSPEQQHAATEAFIKIKEAYQRIMAGLDSGLTEEEEGPW